MPRKNKDKREKYLQKQKERKKRHKKKIEKKEPVFPWMNPS
jgi:hypothetical protein